MTRLLLPLAIILTTVCNICQCQDLDQDYCVRSTNTSTKEILKNYPFSQARTIKLVSFKPTGQIEEEYKLPMVNGVINQAELLEEKTLTKKNKSTLLDILINYNYDPKFGGKIEARIGMCYMPRHAILFENEAGHIFGYIELCFECLRYKVEPKDIKIGRFCYDKYKMLKDFFNDNGIKYYTDKQNE